MDKITHEVRRANWKSIIEQCQQRPKDQTAKQWLRDHGISEKSYYYWLRKIRSEVYERMSATDLPDAIQGAAASFAEIPVRLPEDLTSSNLPFQADAVIHFGKLTIGLSNSISDTLLKQMLEVIAHVS